MHTDALTDLLDQIDAGLSPLELEERLAVLGDQGLVDEETAKKAVRINGRLWEAKRKEGLLGALYDISNDLVEARDHDAVLDAVVKRTRRLLNADIAYLSLNDHDRGVSYVRTTDGVVTDAFKNITLPLGSGVLGSIATGHTPLQSVDYLPDRAFPHLPEVDDAVAGEGIRSMLGVPLVAEANMIGVLLVANRYPHRFSSEDVSTLTSIGGNAAVVLRNASTLAAKTEALGQLQAAQDENLAHLRALESITRLDRGMIRALTAGSGTRPFARFLEEAFSASVQIFDATGAQLASTASAPSIPIDELSAAVDAARSAAGPVGAMLAGKPRTLVLAVAGKRELGSVLIGRAFDGSERAALDRVALAVCVAFLMDSATAEAEERLREELVEKLVDPDLKMTTGLLRRLASAKLATDGEFVVHVVSVDEGERSRALAITRKAVTGLPVIVAFHEQNICIIEGVVAASAATGTRVLKTLAGHQIVATVGSSRRVDSLSSLADAHGEAVGILAALEQLGRSGEAADAAQLGSASIMMTRNNKEFLCRFVTEQLAPLLEYDEKNGTDLVRTARIHLDSDRSLADTARQLHIHGNTLRQRLNRIGLLLGDRWSDGRRRLDVHIALRTLQVTKAE
jgi:uncharacterized protein YigA (DUF484 family)